MDTIDEDEEVQEEGDPDSIEMFVEMKYCSICHLEQPLRTKHCKKSD